MSTRQRPQTNITPRTTDRTTVIAITAVAIAVIILILLIALITLIPAQTISQTLQAQAGEQQRLLAGSLSRQMENYFNNIAYDLIGLVNRPEIKTQANDARNTALNTFTDVATAWQGSIRSIVRVDGDGNSIYAWPTEFNDNIALKQPLRWSVDASWVDIVARRRTVQLLQQRLNEGGSTYLLAAPVTEGLAAAGVVVFELDINQYFEANFKALDLGKTGQLWVFDQFGSELYHLHQEPSFRGNVSQLPHDTQPVILKQFPTDDRESAVASIFAAFSRSNQTRDASMTIVLSRSSAEAQAEIFETVRSLFLFGIGIVAVIVVFGFLTARFLLRETNRRRTEEQRRSTARTLLTTARALNSSLDLNIVLQRILDELAKVLPHDDASIMLLDDEKRVVTIAASTSNPTDEGQALQEIPLNTLRGAREVVLTGRPVYLNDTMNDPRWRVQPNNKVQSWLGVPLRVREEAVGLLNIDSYSPNRFTADDVDLAEAFADQAGVAIQNARSHEFEIKVFEQELETARMIQTSLLPQEVPPLPQIELASRNIPARQVSGDFYQYYVLPDNRLGVAVGDVSGKGMPAALMMAVTTTLMRDEILRFPDAADLLNQLNSKLVDRMRQNNMNSALMVGIFNPENYGLDVANGGMVQPYLRTNGKWENIEVGGYPIGASSRSNYRAQTVTIPPGSMLVMVSDGVVESQNTKNEFFGFEGLENLLDSMPSSITAEEITDKIIAAVRQHLGELEPQDDITVVALKSC